MHVIHKFLVYIIFFILLLNKCIICLDTVQDENIGTAESIVQPPRHKNFTFLITGGYRPVTNYLGKYIVSIRRNVDTKYFGSNHFCAGTIISKNVILTAAHCTASRSAKSLHIAAGTPRRLEMNANTQIVPVKRIIQHFDFSKRTQQNDIALLHLSHDLKLDGEWADSMKLPEEPTSEGTQCISLGWGTLFEKGPLTDAPLYVNLTVFNHNICGQMWKNLRKSMICANNMEDITMDTCQGDSGGPLLCGGAVAGIVSFGYGCGEHPVPGVYTDVYYFRDWIQKNFVQKLSVNLRFLISLFVLILYV